MFDNLSERLERSFKILKGEGRITEINISETVKDIAGSTVSQSMTINDGSTTSTAGRWGMQALQNAYQKAANALSKSIRKNKVKVKYGTQVYLINSKEKRNR